MKKSIIAFALLAVFTAGAFANDRGISDRSKRTVADGPHPRVFGYANAVAYGAPGNPDNLLTDIAFNVTIDPNGNSAERVFFLSIRNQATGAVRYIDTSGLLDEGVLRAMNGTGPDNFTANAVTTLDDVTLVGDGGVVTGAIGSDALGTGNYQICLDLREGSGQRTVTKSCFNFSIVDALVLVDANISGDSTWTSNNAYFINNQTIFVDPGGTLTIEPGTVVFGTGQVSALVVDRGGQIFANGTQARPIIMTSANDVGERTRAQWGGLIINGRAPINTGEQQGEGGTRLFGGDDPEDDSGSLTYVRVEFAGIEFSPDNELNGIAFQGVGRGTHVSHIQVHFNQDDGVEFFGGTVDAKYVLTTGIGDDNIDWVLGWIGRLQFAVAQQRPDDGDQGIEADNLENNNNLLPRSNPTLYNITLVGVPTSSSSDIGMLLREGTAGKLRNGIVTGFNDDAVDIDFVATVDQINSGDLTVRNFIFWDNKCDVQDGVVVSCPNDATQFDTDDSGEEDDAGITPGTTQDFITSEPTNRLVNPGLRDPFSELAPDFRPQLNSSALNRNFVEIPPDDGFFCTTIDFIGGVDPTDDWTQGWTYFGPF
ncbi:MAG TPA: hypothetical protein VLV83_16820 [Acidobacteriota bacterium]|nr:hypothetical protein [Acidobacteriota bacterium]